MINKILLISFGKLALIWLTMYILIVIINYKNMQDKKKFEDSKEIKKDKVLAQIYLDQFYINNKVYTFFMTYIYILGMILIFVFLRYLSINDFMIIQTQESLYNIFIFLLIIYVLIFITIVFYKSLLTVLCEKEFNKFFIYIKQYHWMYQLNDILEYKVGDKILGSLYLITYRISTLEYKYPFYGLEFERAHRFVIDDESTYIIHNKKIIDYAYLATHYAKRYVKVQRFFRILSYIFRFCYKHISKVNELFPYFLLSIIFVIELYNREFHYIYLMLFVYLLIKIKRDFLEYKNSRDVYYDGILSRYFYNNQVSYKEQRIHFYMKNNMNIHKSFTSDYNANLFRSMEDIINYTFNNFKDNYKPSFETKQEERRNQGMYRRFWVILGFLFISYYMLTINKSLLILLFPILFMIYTHYRTYYISVYALKPDDEEYEYNRKYNIIFWIFTMIQGYIFWLLLLKPELLFMNTEVLLRLPQDLGMFVKVYSIDEKIIYLYNYFEYYIGSIDNEYFNKDYLRYIIRQINYEQLINDTVKLKDLQIYVKLLIDNYYVNETIYRMLAEYINKEIIEENLVNPWYIFMRNVLFISALTSTLIYNKNIWLITKQIYTSEGAYRLVKDIYLGTIKNKLTYETLVNIIMKIFKW